MKKLWTDPDVIRRAERRRAKLERRRKRLARGLTKHPRRPDDRRFIARDGRRRMVLVAPGVFSLVDNEIETQAFFKNLSQLLLYSPGVYLDMRGVTHLSADAIMYLLAVIDVHAQWGKVDIAGNAPRNSRAASLLAASGFYNYVDSSADDKYAHPDVKNRFLKIASGKEANPVTVGAAITWACEHLKLDYECEAASVSYETLIECVSNVQCHAYKYRNPRTPKPLWWLAAVYDEPNGTVIFTVLDMGSGIPKTLRLTRPQRVQRLLKLGHATEVALIQKALQGYFPSQTRLRHRGKGLPAIKTAMDNDLLSGLILVSGRAYLNYGDDRTTNFKSEFTGTLYSWKLSPENDAQ